MTYAVLVEDWPGSKTESDSTQKIIKKEPTPLFEEINKITDELSSSLSKKQLELNDMAPVLTEGE